MPSWRHIRRLIRQRWRYLTHGLLRHSHVPIGPELVEACKANDLALVRSILSTAAANGSLVDAADSKGITALRVAAENGYAHTAMVLLEHGADPNQVGTDGWAVIHSAIVEGSSHIVEVLLAGGADPYLKGSYGWNALHTAVASGRQRLVRLILRRDLVVPLGLRQKADGNASELVLASTTSLPRPLSFAGSYVEGIDTAETAGAAGASSSAGPPPLERKAAIMNKVIRRQQQQDDDDDPDDPLRILASARMPRSKQSIDQARQQTVDAQTDHGQTALHLASHEGHSLCMRLLLLHGADPNIVDDKGRTPLGEACRRRNLICIDLLLKHGALKNGLAPFYPEPVQVILDSHPCVPSLKTLCIQSIRRVLRGKATQLRNLPPELVDELQTMPNNVEASLQHSTTIHERRGRLSQLTPTSATLNVQTDPAAR